MTWLQKCPLTTRRTTMLNLVLIVGGIAVFLFIVILMDCFCTPTKSFYWKTYIYNKETWRVKHVFEKETNIPTNDPLLKDPYRALQLELKHSRVEYVITFVTEQQVIRKFECMIDLKIKDIDEQGLQSLLDFLRVHGEIRIGKIVHALRTEKLELVWEYPVRKMLPIICKENLAQLKELDNPYDDKQQEAFNNLVRNYLEPLLSDTEIEILGCRFFL